MNRNEVVASGELLAKAWLENQTIDRLSGALLPRDRESAIAVQDEMTKQIGLAVVGWKVGGELVGRVFEPDLFTSPATLPLDRYRDTYLEVELGFRLLADLPPRHEPYRVDEVADVAALVPTFEMVGTRFSGDRPDPQIEGEFPLAYADNGLQVGVVVGAEIDDWRSLALLDIPVEVSIDGGDRIPNVPREKRREPLEVLVWLANDLSGRGIGLHAGQVVAAGAAAGPEPMGRTALAVYGDFGQVEATLVDSVPIRL